MKTYRKKWYSDVVLAAKGMELVLVIYLRGKWPNGR